MRAPQPAVPPQRAPRPPAVPGWGASGPGPAPALARGGAGRGQEADLAALPHGLHRVLAALAARVPSLSVRHQLRVRRVQRPRQVNRTLDIQSTIYSIYSRDV